MLARWLEREGLPTCVVTMMPELATRLGAPRVVGVEFPFGHPFGLPGDEVTRGRVLGTALTVLAGANDFGTRVDVDLEWPVPLREAYKCWQPPEPSPIVKLMLERLRVKS